ncbi:DUF4956 domain-containing protein [Propioniciclava coleopterorum]|uniref:DUF4956 domain-containing protein n=1 Tax=Propioniciclava coleopterorum TaxID=2714937 RepID=A0A6G7Y7W2_9ACTN|nr:DUF4956 domain-containing protein [Propioniciclava coleopterorum]QIK72766.1 DUF4956 domain-containing protein [Propioniciclava coleopterorum]
MLSFASLVAVGTDLVAATILAVALYYPRHHRRDLMFAFLTLNVGVMAVTLALGTTEASVGLGLGLFGVLSIIRLRSDAISQGEIAYYFSALALGLLGGLAPFAWWVTPTLSALILLVVTIADHPKVARRITSITLTLDEAILDPDLLERTVSIRLGAPVRRISVHEVDLVRDLTVLDVWYAPIRHVGPRYAAIPSPALPHRAPETPQSPITAPLRSRADAYTS